MIKKYKLDDKGNGQLFTCNTEVYSGKSKFQKINIDDLQLLGRVLVLDDIIQLSQLDCDSYHESFSHIPMLYVKNASRVLILGGGDGILAKELLKYENVKIDIVDIDKEVCDLSRLYLSDLNEGALNNKRVTVFNEDALSYCEKIKKNSYDVILGDITDPHPNSPSASLLSKYALDTYKNILKEKGVIAIQTDNNQIAKDHVNNIKNKLKKNFNNVKGFSIIALTLGGLFSFVMATNNKFKRRNISVKTKWLNEEKVKLSLSLDNYNDKEKL